MAKRTHSEKIYQLGETTAALIALWRAKPEEFNQAVIFDKIVDKYADLELDLEEGGE